VRQLFRKEYAHEQEEMQMALDAEPAMAFVHRISSGQIETPTEPRIEIADMAEPSEVLEPAEATVDGDKPRGFWASLFKRKK
jgi:hypothetical protein